MHHLHKYANNPPLQTGDKCFTCFVFLSSGSLLTQLKLCLGRTVTTTPIITEELPLGHYCNNNPSHSLLYCSSPLSHHTTSSLCTKKERKKPHTTVRRHYLLRAQSQRSCESELAHAVGLDPKTLSHMSDVKMQTGETPCSLRTECVRPHSDPSFFFI